MKYLVKRITTMVKQIGKNNRLYVNYFIIFVLCLFIKYNEI